MAYTYDDFVKAANQSGLMGQFSQDDLNLAQKYPEFGLSVLSLKKDYNNATTAEQRLLANQAANELRKSYGNYSGGADGGSFRLESKLNRRSDDLLDQLGSFGSFSYDEAPTYENTFAQQQKDLLDRILNREDFSWSKETDPQWSSYKKSYLREGDRATANALAQASAASGGRPSSHAVNAATQAGDYYATKLNDVIPTLYQQAYERYLDEYNMKLKDLNTVNQQEQLDYAKYLDRLGQFIADVQGQDQIDYARYLDEVSRQQTAQDSIRSQVDAILAAGGSPSANLVSESGYSSEYVMALEDAYRKQVAEKAAKKSGSGGGGTMSLTTAKAMAKEGQFTDTVLNTLRKAGFTDDYIAQVYGYTGFGTGRDKLGYDEDEGIFTWNGRRYNSPEALAEDLDRANLTDAEKATISRRLKASGFNITF